MIKPKLIKAGDERVKLGMSSQPVQVDCRIVAEGTYRIMIELLERASGLVGNPGTNISSSCDIAVENWQKDYDIFIKED